MKFSPVETSKVHGPRLPNINEWVANISTYKGPHISPPYKPMTEKEQFVFEMRQDMYYATKH